MQINLAKRIHRDPRLIDIEETMAELSYMPNPRDIIRHAIGDIVWGSSILQTVQGFLSAGVFRSVKYALEKLKKRAAGSSNTDAVSFLGTEKSVTTSKESNEQLKNRN